MNFENGLVYLSYLKKITKKNLKLKVYVAEFFEWKNTGVTIRPRCMHWDVAQWKTECSGSDARVPLRSRAGLKNKVSLLQSAES